MLKKLTPKVWWALTALSLLAAVLAACGGDEQPAPGPTARSIISETPQGTTGPSPTAASVAQTPTGPAQTPSAATPSTPGGAEAEMGVDAIAGGAIDASRTVADTNPFEVDVLVLNAGPGYQGYQFKAQWDEAVLAYDSQVDLMPEELNLCATPTAVDNWVFAGCARIEGNTSFQGPVNTLTFHCVGEGTSTIHLLTVDETSGLETTLLGYRGVAITTGVVDASVTCTG